MELVYYLINDLLAKHPGLPLKALKKEYIYTLGAMRNEKLWILGSNNEDEISIKEYHMKCYQDYCEWLQGTAMELYGERI